jgi:hypothetical protein
VVKQLRAVWDFGATGRTTNRAGCRTNSPKRDYLRNVLKALCLPSGLALISLLFSGD